MNFVAENLYPTLSAVIQLQFLLKLSYIIYNFTVRVPI